MTYLIDTNIFIWFIEGRKNISKKHREIIENKKNRIFLSIISIWEIAIKYSLNKLELNRPFQHLIPDTLIANDIDILPIELKHIEYLLNLSFHHRDPFDRIIIAQSIVEKLPLLYTDEKFDLYPLIKTEK